MIHEEDYNVTNNTSMPYVGLSKEESFFLELLQKREEPIINIRYTSEGLLYNNLESFLSYYTEQEIIGLLENLVIKKIIKKDEKGGILLCPNCGHHTSMLIFSCPRCGSSNVGLQEDLIHPECGYIGSREEFVKGVLIRCPRCELILNQEASKEEEGHYTISDSYFECQDCGTKVSKKDFDMICIKCNTKFETVAASYLFSVSYMLVSDPLLKQGALKRQSELSQNNEEESREKVANKFDELKKSPVIKKQTDEMDGIESETQEKVETELDELKKSPVIKKQTDEMDGIESETQEKVETELDDKGETIIENPLNSDNHEYYTWKDPSKSQYNEPKTTLKEKLLNEYRSDKNIIPSYRWWVNTKSDVKKTPSNITRDESFSPIQDEPENISSSEMDEAESVEFNMEKYESNKISSKLIDKNQIDYNSKEEYQILLIIENPTIAELIIENLEYMKKPIQVLYVDEGTVALEALRNQYDVIILDLDLKIEEKNILSEIEKLSILTPIIALSHSNHEEKKNNLNIKALLKKKQDDYYIIISILEDLFKA